MCFVGSHPTATRHFQIQLPGHRNYLQSTERQRTLQELELTRPTQIIVSWIEEVNLTPCIIHFTCVGTFKFCFENNSTLADIFRLKDCYVSFWTKSLIRDSTTAQSAPCRNCLFKISLLKQPFECQKSYKNFENGLY